MAYSPQRKLDDSGRLLDEKGRLAQYGWSVRPFAGYSRNDIPLISRPAAREWDSYIFGDSRWQICISMADLGYAGTVSAAVVNLGERWHKSVLSIDPMTLGSYEMPGKSDFGDIVYRSRELSLNITIGQNERRITLRCPNFDDVKELYITAVFSDLHDETMSAVIPFKNRHAFFCTRQIGCMPVEAHMRYGGIETYFSPSETLGSFRWCRGILPNRTGWLQCSANGMYGGERFALSFRQGFGIRTDCGENVFFYKGRAYKLGELDITPPDDRVCGAWTFIGEDGDVNLRMVPTYAADESAHLILPVSINRQRCFGTYSGTVMLRDDEGGVERLVLDGIGGFAEEVWGKW